MSPAPVLWWDIRLYHQPAVFNPNSVGVGRIPTSVCSGGSLCPTEAVTGCWEYNVSWTVYETSNQSNPNSEASNLFSAQSWVSDFYIFKQKSRFYRISMDFTEDLFYWTQKQEVFYVFFLHRSRRSLEPFFGSTLTAEPIRPQPGQREFPPNIFITYFLRM